MNICLISNYSSLIIILKAEVCSSFIITTVRDQSPRSHHKGATSRVQTGNPLYPALLCHCQLGSLSLELPPSLPPSFTHTLCPSLPPSLLSLTHCLLLSLSLPPAPSSNVFEDTSKNSGKDEGRNNSAYGKTCFSFQEQLSSN